MSVLLLGLWLAFPVVLTVAPMASQRVLHQFEPLLVICTGILERLDLYLPPLGVLILGLLGAGIVSGSVRAARLIRRTSRLMPDAPRYVPARLRGAAERAGLVGRVRCARDPGAFAYTIGLIAPVVVVSHGALSRLRDDELLSVMAHEAHHVRARDPLRILLARVLAGVFFGVPLVAWLVERSELLAELDADRAALRLLGDPAPLAGALLALDERPAARHLAVGAWSLAGPRVDQLCGVRPRGPRLRVRTIAFTAMSLLLAFALALGQGVRAHALPADAFGHEIDVPVTEHCPLPPDGILL